MIKKTWQTQGIAHAALLAEQNLHDMYRILQWNITQDIRVYRMSSDIFPWMSEYRFEDLPNYAALCEIAHKIGELAHTHNLRLTFHPGQFDVLASPTESIVTKTICDLDQHARIMDMMGLPANRYSAINIHIGGTYGDKESAAARFCENFKRLAESTQKRLVVENDDKASQFSVKDLYDLVYINTACSITFDHLHHRFCTGDLTARDAAHLAARTWDKVTPLQHYSSSKIYEDATLLARSHSDYVYEVIPDYDIVADVEIEAKAKDLALLKYRQDLNQIHDYSIDRRLLITPLKLNFEE